ncbi:acyl-CoA dehydrogenase [Amycolatopsis minnesotensis]|uniref:Acyl-CoA dehydrogenase n=1 Tax=Amycolatopsis minnesotensis TaxID=337894 RepID=A0ABN2RB85_9PSEU
MPIAITEEQAALAVTIRSWAAEKDADFAGLAKLGLFAAALPESVGGAGGDVTDLASGLEEVAAALVPGPVFGTALAGLALAADHAAPVAAELLPGLVAGSASAAVAWEAPVPGDWPVLSGRIGPVFDADDDTWLILSSAAGGWFALPPGTPGVTVTPVESFDPSRSCAFLDFDRVAVPEAALLDPGDGTIADLAATVASAEAAGIAAWCLRTASDYAKVREQFGRPIGTFQAVKHLCADMLCRAEATAALAWDAARAAAGGSPSQRSCAASAALAVALDAAVDNAKDCIQVLGGIGFTWEHGAHFRLRRAISLRQVFGGGARWRERTARLALDGTRREIALDVGTDESVAADVAEIAAVSGAAQRIRLAETGYLTPHWPKPYGLDASPSRQLVIDAELAKAGVERPDLVIGGWAAPTILAHGTEAQREKFVGPTLRGEIVWCQLFSEPEAGSDLASLRTAAAKVPGGWRLRGQKVWTSLAHEAHWAICLARTDASVPKHRGITYFLVDMTADGLKIRPLREITGDEMFNEVFLDDVFVPDDHVVGEPGDGWRLARTTLANERVAMSRGSSLGDDVETLLGGVRDPDDGTLERLGALVADGFTGALLDVRAILRRLDGHGAEAESSVRKLLGVRHRQEVAEFALDLLGRTGSVVTDETAKAQHEFLLTRCLSIAGGTTQILRSVAAERLLGLPRK